MKRLLAVAALVLLTGAVHAAEDGGHVQPPPSGAARLAVSLARMQDALANGDRAAAAMQGRILTEMSKTFRGHDRQTLADPRTLRAAVTFLLSGGRADDVETLLNTTPETEPLRWLIKGAAHFARGEPADALKALEPFNPDLLPVSIAGRIALARATVLPDDRRAEKVALLLLAARQMPGTLVEESALRRLIAIAASLSEPGPLLATMKRYVGHYPKSVYAPQTLAIYGAALVELESKGKAADRLTIEVTLNMLAAEQRRSVYLDIARQAMPKGLVDLTLFAATRARRLSTESSDIWHQATLYDAAALIVGPDYDVALDLLARVDDTRLGPQDRALLDASRKLAANIRAPNRATGDESHEVPAESGDAAKRAAAALQSVDDILKELTQ